MLKNLVAHDMPKMNLKRIQRSIATVQRTRMNWLGRCLGTVGTYFVVATFAAGTVYPGSTWGNEVPISNPERERRTALVIGNGAYHEAPLDNPINDARAMADSLSQSGFAVIEIENATLAEIHLAIREFGDELAKGGVGLFYYAGHGIQIDGRNYLIPVDADIRRSDEVAFKSVDPKNGDYPVAQCIN